MVIHDTPLENWGVRGKLLSNVELGFKVDV